jgi:hypothetical protein
MPAQPPGIRVEETPSSAPIPPVGTSTAAFVGTAASGPVNSVSAAITSVADFETVYGKTGNTGNTPDSLNLAVHAFFANGGQKLYISRVSPANGSTCTPDDYTRALTFLEPLADISTVAAPGGAIAGASGIASVAPIHAALIAHASRPQSYRFALLDPPPGCSISEVQTLRAQVNSSNAALYYPSVNVANPLVPPTRAAASKAPPSGFIAGIFARVDSQRGVFKAPANQPLLGAASLELPLRKPTRTRSTTPASTPSVRSRAAASSSGEPALSRPIPSGSTLIFAAISTTSNIRSTMAPSGRSSNRTTSSFGGTFAQLSPIFFTTSGAPARFRGTSPKRLTSYSATERP